MAIAGSRPLLVAVLALACVTPRTASLPLETFVDGPAPREAANVLVFLHGRGGSIARGRALVERLRRAGMPSDASVILVEGPLVCGLGHCWGDTAEAQAQSRARVLARLRDLLGDPLPAGRVVVAGFSQGAGVALDLAVEEPRIVGVASVAPCLSMLRGELPRRDGLRVLLAHGRRDERCPLEESRSLALVLERARRPATYLEFDGGHEIPDEVVAAIVALVVRR